MNEEYTTVTILGRAYKLRIAEADRRYLEEAARKIEEQSQALGSRYGYKDNQDLLAMTALTKLTQFYKAHELMAEQERKVQGELERIEAMLDGEPVSDGPNGEGGEQ